MDEYSNLSREDINTLRENDQLHRDMETEGLKFSKDHPIYLPSIPAWDAEHPPKEIVIEVGELKGVKVKIVSLRPAEPREKNNE